jgi:hypothetical protein
VSYVVGWSVATDMVNELNESRLVTLVRIALRDTERIWDLTVADKSHMDRQGDDDLEEHLNELEMLEEGGGPCHSFYNCSLFFTNT